MAKTKKIRYLIIGNSAGGVGAAEAIRETDKVGTITMVSDELYPAYSRPLISEYLTNRCSLERMLFRPPDFYEKSNIKTIFGEKVAQVNFNEHTAKLESGGILTWQKLLLATGGLPIIPRIDGFGLKGVFTFTKLDDARAIDQFASDYRKKIRAVVIGGGLIGISVTEALAKRGVEVTIVEMKERILNTILDEEMSALVEETLTQAGVRIITSNTVAEISSSLRGVVGSVCLGDGLLIPCEMVVIAIGVQPRIELVAGTEIKTNRGIVVDQYMAISSPDVYACGDVAEAYDFVYGENRLTPIWPNAYTGGRIAGLNMAGIPTEYPGGTAMNSIKYFSTNIVSAGIVTTHDNSCEVLTAKHDHVYKKVILREGLIVGMVLSGDIEKSGIIYNLMKDGVSVNSFKEVLVADDFGLASLPEEIWRARLAAPPSVSAS